MHIRGHDAVVAIAPVWGVLNAPATGGAGTVMRYGHYGRPVLVFPSEQGRAWDFANNGMVEAVGSLVEAGRVTLYCVDSHDGATWSASHLPMEERAATFAIVVKELIVGIAPIMVMWFGFDWQSKAAVVVLMVFFPMLVNTIAGLAAKQVPWSVSTCSRSVDERQRPPSSSQSARSTSWRSR